MLPTSPVAPIISATTGSPSTSTVTLAGVGGTLYDFSGAGSITCATPGRARVLVIGGGSDDNGGNYGNAGEVFAGWIDFTAGAHTVTVGAVGTGGAAGGHSSIGSLVSAPGGINALSAAYTYGAGRGFGGANYAGYPDTITGSSVTYAGAQGSGLTTYGSNNVTAYAGRVYIFVPN